MSWGDWVEEAAVWLVGAVATVVYLGHIKRIGEDLYSMLQKM